MNLKWCISGREIGLHLLTSIERNSLLTLSTKGTWSWNIIWSSPLILRGPLRCSIWLVIVAFDSSYVVYRFRIMFLLHDTVVKVQDSSCASLGERADQLQEVRWRQRKALQESQPAAVAVVNTQEGISFMSISS